VIWLAAIVFAAVLPYIPSLSGGFVLDDTGLIIHNPLAHSLSRLGRAFLTRFLHGTESQFHYYRPLIIISYQINYALSGPHAFPFRLTNLLLYAAVAVLVYILAKRLTGSALIAGIAGLAFAVLPSHAESVAFIAGRTDVIATLFILTGLLVFISASRRHEFSWLLALLCSALFLCAEMSKEMGLLLPALMAAYVWTFGENERRKDLWKWTAALLPSLVIYLLLRSHALNGVAGQDSGLIFQRMLRVGPVFVTYLRMLFVPRELALDYNICPLRSITLSPIVLAAWLVPIGLIITIVLLRKRNPVLSFGAAWIFLSLLPVVDIISTNTRIPTERFCFTASVGSAMVLGWLFKRILDLRPKSMQIWPLLAGVVVSSYLLYSAALAVQDAQVYRTNLSWARYVAVTKPEWWAFRAIAGSILYRAGDLKAAVSEYEAAVKMDEITEFDKAMAENQMGLAWVGIGDMSKAAEAFTRATEHQPSLASAWLNLGRAELELKNYNAAVAAYERAGKIKKLSAKDSSELSNAYRLAGQNKKAAD